MNPASLLAVINAALALTEQLIPRLAELVHAGEVTADEQSEVLRRFEALKASGDKNFEGPEWKI